MVCPITYGDHNKARFGYLLQPLAWQQSSLSRPYSTAPWEHGAKHHTTRMWANVHLMVALQNTGGALCSMPQSLARGHCSTAAQ